MYTLPAFGLSSPEHTEKSVVFPAPLGPTSPTNEACGTEMLTPSRAVTPPKRTTTSRASNAGVEGPDSAVTRP